MMKYICQKYILYPLLIITIAFSAQKNTYAQKKLYNMGYPINTSGDDFSPSVTEDGRTLLFNSKDAKEDNHNIYICENINGIWTKPKYFDVLNSNYDDETPFISHDGRVILFSSNRENGIYNIFISEKINGEWTEPIKIPGEVNSGANERAPSLSIDKKTLYFTRWTAEDLGQSKIMKASLKDGKFVNVTMLPYPVNTGHFDIGIVPSRLFSGFYFSSQRPKGNGGWDIYFIGYKYGKFGTAINLGLPVNSEDNDMFLSETYNNELFLCTNRGGGYGKYDIYTTTMPQHIIKKIQASIDQIKKDDPGIIFRPGTKKTEDRSILTPDKINKVKDPGKIAKSIIDRQNNKTENKSTDDKNSIDQGNKTTEKNNQDNGLTQNNTSGDQGKNKDNIKEKPKKTKLFFTVISNETKKPVQLKVKVFLKDNEDPLVMEIRSTMRTSNSEGMFQVMPKPDVRYVVIKPVDNSCEYFRKVYKIEPHTHVNYTIHVEQKKQVNELYGKPGDYTLKDSYQVKQRCFNYSREGLTLCPVYFRLNSSHIAMNYFPYLHEIIDYMRINKSSTISIYGHSDNIGRKRFNKNLSVQRARAIKQFFIKFGIESVRIEIIGLGEKCPKTTNKYKKYLNRRVEFKILN